MSRRRWISSRAALGILGGGTLLLVGGCAYIIDFDAYSFGDEASSSGSGVSASASSGAGGSGGGSTGSGGADAGCMPTYRCGIEKLAGETLGGTYYGDIALGKDLVYWARGNALSKVLKDPPEGGESPVDLSSQPGINAFAAVGDKEVYYVETYVGKDNIHRVEVAGKDDVIIGNDDATSLTILDKFIYWPSSTDPVLHKGQIVEPGMPFMPESIANANTGDMPARIVASATQIFWTYQGNGNEDGGIKKLEGDDDADLVTSQKKPSGIATDGDNVYWLNQDGRVHKVSVMGGKVTDGPEGLPGLENFSGRVVVSGSYVYWTGPDKATCMKSQGCVCNETCGAVMSALKGTLDSVTIFAGNEWDSVHGLAADDDYVFWTTQKGNEALLLRKHILTP